MPPRKKAIKKPNFRIAPLIVSKWWYSCYLRRKTAPYTWGRVQAMSGHGHRRKDKSGGGGGGGWRWASHFHVRERGWVRELQLNTVGICPQCIYVHTITWSVKQTQDRSKELGKGGEGKGRARQTETKMSSKNKRKGETNGKGMLYLNLFYLT